MASKQIIEYDRFEFCNAVIGWLGYEEVYQRILGCSMDEVMALIRDPSEELENRIAVKMKEMSIEELNTLAQEFNMDCEIYDL